MSGGYFDYDQHRISNIAEEISLLIENNENKNLDLFGYPKGSFFSEETIKVFKDAEKILNIAYIYAKRIDWLVSGDDGEDNFHKRIKEELEELEEGDEQ